MLSIRLRACHALDDYRPDQVIFSLFSWLVEDASKWLDFRLVLHGILRLKSGPLKYDSL